MSRVVVCFFVMGAMLFGGQAIFSYSPPVISGGNNVSGVGHLLLSRTVTYNFLSEQEISTMATPLFSQLHFSINGAQRTISLMGEKSDLDRFEAFVRTLDHCRPVIEYSTVLMEINRNELQKLGIDWQGFVDQWKMTRLKGINEFLDQVSVLLKNGEAKILANPIVISMADEEAIIRIGDKIPYAVPVEYATKTGWQIQYMDAGIQLKIRGHIVSENMVQAHVYSSISSVKEWKATQGGEYPVLSNREVDLLCHIQNGETMMIGGLTDESKQVNVGKVPLLGDLPVVGSLFQSSVSQQENTEVVFLLMPTIKKF